MCIQPASSQWVMSRGMATDEETHPEVCEHARERKGGS